LLKQKAKITEFKELNMSGKEQKPLKHKVKLQWVLKKCYKVNQLFLRTAKLKNSKSDLKL